MKIISLGLDNSILNKSSALAGRVLEYGRLVEGYSVIVPNQKKEVIVLSDKVKAYGSGGVNKLSQFIKIYRLALKLWREDKDNLITVQDQYYLALIGLKLARNLNAALEIQIHGFEKFSGLRALIAKFVLPRANAVRCVSQRLKKLLIRDFGVKEEKITVVPIYTELRITNYPSRQGEAEAGELRITENKGKFVFLTVGRLVPVKNIELQIEAMREVAKKYPQTELWIIGDGPEKKNCELRIVNYGLSDRVKLLGWKDDLGKYYRQADAFLLTSNSEGWGLAVIEAAGLGLPVIMTDVGCAGEVIENNESGLIIPVGDRNALEQAMVKMITDENLRKKLAAGAEATVSILPNQEEIFNLYKLSWQKAVNNKQK